MLKANSKMFHDLCEEGIKDGKPDLKILPPLYVYDGNNEYTAEVRDILYGKEQ